ncbi:flagellar filament capping protein FliD [Paenibacillus thermotolerans]|uniref:flagellar filament capping protein FliD n=1 Tax=Paenibacillus thermotolerans TaxID=3027807 RepID=UPI002368EEC1|nr:MULTISPECIES: flagellar filament capping protein FliD [unclassified Paenibacillus]
MVLRVGGLASGIDTDSVIKELMKARRIPLQKLQNKNKLLEWKREDYLDMNSKILDYRNNKVFKFTLEGVLSNKKADIKGSTDGVSVKTSANSQNGTIVVDSVTLAKAASNYSASNIANGSFKSNQSLQSQRGNLSGVVPADETVYKFKINGKEVTVNTAEESLDAVIRKINATTGVTAYYDANAQRVSFVAKETGLVNGTNGGEANIKFEDTQGNFLTDVLKVTTGAGAPYETAATNATVKINGLTTTRTSNTFTVNGVEITLQKTGTQSTITVSNDVDATVTAVKDFIKDYNEILETLYSEVNEKKYRGFDPLTEEQRKDMSESDIKLWEEKARSGLLRNDSYISGAIFGMRTAIVSPVNTGSSKYKTLSSIGIETGEYFENGKLYLKDEEEFKKALQEDPEAVVKLFSLGGAGDGSESGDVGIAQKIYNLLDKTLDQIKETAGTSATLKDESVLGKEWDKLQKQIKDYERRVSQVEERYYRQFTAMERAISMYNSQSAYLANAFGNGQR